MDEPRLRRIKVGIITFCGQLKTLLSAKFRPFPTKHLNRVTNETKTLKIQKFLKNFLLLESQGLTGGRPACR